jgi:hypothetical protein
VYRILNIFIENPSRLPQAMYTERGGGFLNNLAREEGRVALAGVGLVFLHTAGTKD